MIKKYIKKKKLFLDYINDKKKKWFLDYMTYVGVFSIFGEIY